MSEKDHQAQLLSPHMATPRLCKQVIEGFTVYCQENLSCSLPTKISYLALGFQVAKLYITLGKWVDIQNLS